MISKQNDYFQFWKLLKKLMFSWIDFSTNYQRKNLTKRFELFSINRIHNLDNTVALYYIIICFNLLRLMSWLWVTMEWLQVFFCLTIISIQFLYLYIWINKVEQTRE